MPTGVGGLRMLHTVRGGGGTWIRALVYAKYEFCDPYIDQMRAAGSLNTGMSAHPTPMHLEANIVECVPVPIERH